MSCWSSWQGAKPTPQLPKQHGRGAVPGRRRQPIAPGHLRVVVRVHVDEARRHQLAARVDLLGCPWECFRRSPRSCRRSRQGRLHRDRRRTHRRWCRCESPGWERTCGYSKALSQGISYRHGSNRGKRSQVPPALRWHAPPAWTSHREKIAISCNRRPNTREPQAMPKTRLVRRNHRPADILLQRLQDRNAAKARARDENAVGRRRTGCPDLRIERFDLLLETHSLAIEVARRQVAPLPARIDAEVSGRLDSMIHIVTDGRFDRVVRKPRRQNQERPFDTRSPKSCERIQTVRRGDCIRAERSGELDTTAASQPLPPTTLLEVWPSTTAERRMAANCRQPRCRSSVRSTPLLFSRQRAQGAPAVTLAACTDTPRGAIAHHSASGTASLPTMNSPIRARQPQLSSCVTNRAFQLSG